MANDPYQVLGVSKTADKKAIRAAYRKMAKQYHPDVAPGDKAAEEKFKQASSAFALLNNDEERARFDRGEIDANGNPRNPFAGGGGAGQRGPHPGGYPGGFAPGGFDDISDILSELFGRQGARRAQQPFGFRGEDVKFKLDIDLVSAITGDSRQVRMNDGKAIKLTIPPGMESGQSLRLKGQGLPGMNGGAPGDAIVEINILPHKFYQPDGVHLRLDLPIGLSEAVQGAKVKVPTPHGAVSLRIPPNTSSGKIFRLKGKGGAGPRGAKGDLLVRAMIVLPEAEDAALKDFVDNWQAAGTSDPRKALFS